MAGHLRLFIIIHCSLVSLISPHVTSLAPSSLPDASLDHPPGATATAPQEVAAGAVSRINCTQPKKTSHIYRTR